MLLCAFQNSIVCPNYLLEELHAIEDLLRQVSLHRKDQITRKILTKFGLR